ncbi:MAG: (Na+)-NQR maturation NqrM [Gammaproteobacteria bacterium]|nr:(Na+)-NQR maturation NqrM [Gammaproteobacteria bacterium]
MKILFITFVFMALVVLIMSVGVIFKRKPIAGTCGGLAAAGIEGDCEICGGNIEKCEEVNEFGEGSSATVIAYDATKLK